MFFDNKILGWDFNLVVAVQYIHIVLAIMATLMIGYVYSARDIIKSKTNVNIFSIILGLQAITSIMIFISFYDFTGQLNKKDAHVAYLILVLFIKSITQASILAFSIYYIHRLILNKSKSKSKT